MISLDDLDRPALEARRARLAALTDGRPLLLPAGIPRPRNYLANAHPFRASSHFIYLVGLGEPEAWLYGVDGRFTIHAPAPSADDALWHGPRPSFEALAEATGCAFAPLETLTLGSDVATLAAPDLATRAAQAARLRRELERHTLADEALADAMIALRMRHDEAALRGLREAAEATEAAHLAGMAASAPGRRESEIRAAMEGACIARDLELAYPPIVTVHGEVLHNHAHHHLCQAGDLLLADVGAESRGGWAGDVTRTWPVSGRFSETQREIYTLVLASQEAAIAACVPGARYRDVHLTAARVLTEGLVALGVLRGDVDALVADGVHALFFPHGVGHLIGLDVHDMEDLGDRAGYAVGRDRATQFGLSNLRLDRDLELGMAVTIEPGFYQVPAILADPTLSAHVGDRLDRAALARFADVRGIRIEDDVLITERGPEVLTASIPKGPDAVEAAVGG